MERRWGSRISVFVPNDSAAQSGPALRLLYRVAERRHPLHTDLKLVPGFDRTDTAGRSRQDNVTRQERDVGRYKADQIETVEDQVAGVGILA